MSFLIEWGDIILIKYFILFLISYYSQLVPIYYSCKKINFIFSNNTWIFWFFGGKIVFFFFLLKYNHHCWFFIIFVKFLDWIVAIWIENRLSTTKMKYIITKKNWTRVLRPSWASTLVCSCFYTTIIFKGDIDKESWVQTSFHFLHMGGLREGSILV